MTCALAAISLATACLGLDDEVRARIATAIAAEAPALTIGGDESLELSPEVRAFYEARDGDPLWTNRRGLNRRGRAALATLRGAGDEGLNPERYAVTTLVALADSGQGRNDAADADRLRDLELLLTSRYLLHLEDLAVGAVEPRTAALDSLWHRRQLEAIAQGDDPVELAASLLPITPQYAGLRNALARYVAIATDGGWATLPEGEGEEVILALRERLAAEGDEQQRDPPAGDTGGTFDADLRTALRHFQTRHSMKETGELDDATRAALNMPIEERLNALRLSMDRWRSLPREFGDLHIFVNIPSYELDVVENGEPILDMRVVVGRDVNPTPAMTDTMEYIVLNPYWNVPESIVNEEILPLLREAPEYLAQQNMEVVDRDGEEPVIIDPESIDWEEEADTFPYHIRQRPGPGNALGQVKFMFPNAANIYLHDTPADVLFDETHRAFSHGCVRVEKPMELVNLIVERATELAPASVDSMLAGETEKHVELDQAIPVHLAYLTVWVDDETGIRFLPDLYDKDAGVKELAHARLVPLSASESRRGGGL
ncbi:MAG: L,D-transpeptidase family protein [Longimicrobiales bacterium]